MSCQSFRLGAIRYWEPRRILYNLALVPPAFIGYLFTASILYVGDSHATHYGYLLLLFGLSALGANICYAFAYALELLLGNDDPASRWMRYGRTMSFVFGVVIAMMLALLGGRNIAELEFHHHFRSN